MNMQKEIARVLYATTLAKLHMAQHELADPEKASPAYADWIFHMQVVKSTATAELDALDGILREPDEDIMALIKKAGEATSLPKCKHAFTNGTRTLCDNLVSETTKDLAEE